MTNRQLPLAATGCACCAPASPGQAGPDGTDVPSAPTYLVRGMTCGHCAGRVSDALRTLEAVQDVQINLVPDGDSAVVVTGPADPQAVRTAIEKAGYTLADS